VVEQKYIDYWRDRQMKEQMFHKKLADQARQEVKLIVNLLIQQYDVRQVILFGSLTRDRFVAESDIDLAVEGLPPASYFEILAQVNRLASRWVDLKLWEDLDPHFKSRVLETGEVLHARE
jgi:predicted nucleotidyltransferase